MDEPDVEAHFYLWRELNKVKRDGEDQWRTRSFTSLTVPVKLWTTPLAPADRPPSALNPSSCRIVLKSSCAARECRKRGRWCFFANESWDLVASFIASRSESPQIECLTETPYVVSRHLRNAIGHSLSERPVRSELHFREWIEHTKPAFSNSHNTAHSTKMLRDNLIESCQITLSSQFRIVAHLRASRGMTPGSGI